MYASCCQFINRRLHYCFANIDLHTSTSTQIEDLCMPAPCTDERLQADELESTTQNIAVAIDTFAVVFVSYVMFIQTFRSSRDQSIVRRDVLIHCSFEFPY